MNGSLKKSARTLYGVCACIIVLMVICYFGVSNSKGTYSVADSCKSFNVPSGQCGDDEIRSTNGSLYCAGYTYTKRTMVKCSTTEDGIVVEYTWYKYSKSGTTEAACYVANNKYQWFESNPGSPWKKSPLIHDKCTGCVAGYVENNDGDCISASREVTITFKNGDTIVKSESCTIPAGSQACINDIVAPVAQTSSDENKVFNGWGESKECKNGTYTANAALRPAVSKIYYACYRESASDDKPSSDFDSSKCTYSSLYTVTRDERYLNCKYTNITYNNSATEDTSGNIKACCTNKGYTWVSENFTSSGYGNEYCIVCTSTPGGGNTGGGGTTTPSSSSLTGPGSPTPSSNVDDNPKTGSVAIFMVWVIALGTLIYSFVYFKQSKFE